MSLCLLCVYLCLSPYLSGSVIVFMYVCICVYIHGCVCMCSSVSPCMSVHAPTSIVCLERMQWCSALDRANICPSEEAPGPI